MTRDEIGEYFRRIQPAGKPRTNETGGRERGDHDLNPDFLDSSPMTPAAVLVPLVAHDDAITVLLTLRTDHLNNHAGQISFPGGRVEEQDDGPVATALRETEEEVGLDRARIEVIGRLDDYAVRTGFLVTPVVGLISPPLDLALDQSEVAEAFEVPLAFFMDPANHRRDERTFNGATRQFYAMPYEDYYIWGATAGMLHNLYELLAAR